MTVKLTCALVVRDPPPSSWQMGLGGQGPPPPAVDKWAWGGRRAESGITLSDQGQTRFARLDAEAREAEAWAEKDD